MFRFRLIFFQVLAGIILLQLCPDAHAQADPQADSIRTLAMRAASPAEASDRWLDLSKFYRKTNLDSSQSTLIRAIKAAEMSGDTERQTRCLMSQGALKWMMGDYTAAERHYQKALRYWQGMGSKVEMARCLLNLGSVCQKANRNKEAAAYLRTAIVMASQAGEKLIEAQAGGALANVHYQMGEPDSIGKYSDIALQGFEALHDTANMARVYSNLGFFYRELGKTQEAREPFNKALQLLESIDEVGLQGEIQESYGQLEFDLGNHEEALRHYLFSRNCFAQLKWHRKIANSNIRLGLCYKSLGRRGAAYQHFAEAYRLSDSVESHMEATQALVELADMRAEEKEHDAAISLYRKAIAHSRIGIEEPLQYGTNMGLSRSFSALGKLDSAALYLSLATTEAERMGKPQQIASCHLEAASLALARRQLDAAMAGVKKAREIYTQQHDAEGLSNSYSLESQCLEAMGRLPEALAAERTASQWQDSVVAFSAYEQLLAMEAKYWSEHKQHDLDMALQNEALSNMEAERAEASRARAAAQRNFLLTAMVLLATLGAAAYWITRKHRQSKMRQKLADLRLVALRAQMNPHFIFNALGSVQLLINTSAIREANLYLSKFAQLLRTTLERSGESEGSLQDELEALRLYIDLEALRFKFQYDIQVDPHLHAEEVRFPTLLLQPIVENAVKHGLSANHKDGMLTIRIKAMGTEILCQIEDNGVGRQASHKRVYGPKEDRRSFGLQITRERLGLLQPPRNDRMTIHDLMNAEGQPAGTRVDILVPQHPL